MASKSKKRADDAAKTLARIDKNSSRIVGAFVLLIFTIHPLMVGNDPVNGAYGNITATKLNTFYILFFAALIVTGVYLMLELVGENRPRPLGEKERFYKKVRLYEWAVAGYVVMLVLSLIFSIDTAASFSGTTSRNEGFVTMLAYVLTAVLVGRFYKPRERDLLIFCGVACLVCAYGICQYYGNDFLGLFYEGYERSSGPSMFVFSTMSNTNVISTYSSMALVLCVVLFSQYTSPIQWVYVPISWVIFFQLLLGRTDSGYLGLAGAFGLCFALIAKDRKCAARFFFMMAGLLATMWVNIIAYNRPEWIAYEPHPFAALQPYLLPAAAVVLALAAALFFLPDKLPRLPKRVWRLSWLAVVLVVVIVAVAAMPAIADATGNPQVEELARVLRGNLDDSFATNRGFIWKNTVSLLTPARLLTGYGPDMFYYVFNEYFYEASIEINRDPYDKAHNEYLQILFDEGAIALLLMLAVFALILWGARKKLEQPAVVAVFTALVFYLIQAFFNISTPFVHPIIWVFWGILAAMTYRDILPLPALKKAEEAK